MVDWEALGAFLHLGDALAAETLCLSGFEVRMKRWDGMAVKSRQEGFCLSRLQSSEYIEETMLEECIHPTQHPVGSWNGKETCDFNVGMGKKS